MSVAPDVSEWLDEESLSYISGLSRDGYKFEDIAAVMGVHYTTLKRWRKEYPEIEGALKRGRQRTDYMVENALLKSALGYRTTETKTILEMDDESGKLVKVKVERVEKDVAPNTTSCQVWLYNRLPDKWKKNRDAFIELDDEESSIKINVIRTSKEDLEKDKDEDIINNELEVEANPEYEKPKRKRKSKAKPTEYDEEGKPIRKKPKRNRHVGSLNNAEQSREKKTTLESLQKTDTLNKSKVKPKTSTRSSTSKGKTRTSRATSSTKDSKSGIKIKAGGSKNAD